MPRMFEVLPDVGEIYTSRNGYRWNDDRNIVADTTFQRVVVAKMYDSFESNRVITVPCVILSAQETKDRAMKLSMMTNRWRKELPDDRTMLVFVSHNCYRVESIQDFTDYVMSLTFGNIKDLLLKIKPDLREAISHAVAVQSLIDSFWDEEN